MFLIFVLYGDILCCLVADFNFSNRQLVLQGWKLSADALESVGSSIDTHFSANQKHIETFLMLNFLFSVKTFNI